MKKYLAIALLSLSVSVMAQEVNDFKEGTTPQDTKTCMDWQNQFIHEIDGLKTEVASLKERLKSENTPELKSELKAKQSDLKAAKSNLKICKKAVASEKAAEKQIQKASQQTAKLQQKKDKAEKAAIKAQQKAANADKKIAAAEQKLIKAKQDAEKAYSAVEKSKSAVENVQTDTGIAEATIQKAQEQKAAAKKMILNGIIVRRDGSSGSQR